jgi:hypothetical protein
LGNEGERKFYRALKRKRLPGTRSRNPPPHPYMTDVRVPALRGLLSAKQK